MKRNLISSLCFNRYYSHVKWSEFHVKNIFREDSPVRSLFSERLIDDRTESSHSYIEFLSHIRQEMRK